MRNEVENAFKRLRATPMIGHQIKGITGKHCKVLARKLGEDSGVAKAHRTMKWLRFALNQAKEEALIAANPLEGLKIKRPLNSIISAARVTNVRRASRRWRRARRWW